MPTSCQVHMPGTQSMDGASRSYTMGTLSSKSAAVRYKHAHAYLFLPALPLPDDAWMNVIQASQFRSDINCNRYLLVKDDLTNSGLGWTARFWSVALLLAARASRVLMEVPLSDDGRGARWCTRPPFTLQCIYQRWTNCPMPNMSDAVIFEDVCGGDRTCTLSGGRRGSFAHTRTLALNLSTILLRNPWWEHAALAPGGNDVIGMAHRFLFGAPRQWVHDLASCTMRGAGLQSGSFQSVHIRLSPEKAREVAKSGRAMPPVEHYAHVARALAQHSGLSSVFVQTANPDALHNFSERCRASLNISFTENPRSLSDAWGGWVTDQHTVSMQAATAAVNAQIARQAAAFLSPSISIWTTFLSYLMVASGRGGRPRELYTSSYVCKSQQRRLRMGYLRLVVKPHRLGPKAAELIATELPPTVIRQSFGRCQLVGTSVGRRSERTNATKPPGRSYRHRQ